MDYLDFAIEVHAHQDNHYVVAVRSLAGEARMTVPFPLTDAALENHLLRIENAILHSAGRQRSTPTREEATVQSFGEHLFTFLLRDELLSRFRACQQLAHDQQQGVRIKLTVSPPELAGLPWEFLYDATRRDYLCLDVNTPLVRYPELPLTVQPLPVTSPLRILGLCIDTTDLGHLNVAEEKARMEQAVQDLQARGLVELTWLPGQTADDLQRALRRGPWHVLHFIGHGDFDKVRDQGRVLLADKAGQAKPLYATQLARLLASQRHTLRLVLLNACDGARGGQTDLFSSTATILMGSGIPAVLAMQYAITDAAAVQFAHTFYEALADNFPVDTAVAEARKAMISHNHYSLEWGTPVLYLRAPDGRLFALNQPSPNNDHQSVASTRQTAPDNIPANVMHIRTTSEQWHKPANEPAPAKIIEPRPPIDFDWVTIPAGEFTMGSDKAKDKHAYDNELRQHRLYLPEYRIARVPVTVMQFTQFVQATGYQTTAEKEGSARGWNGAKWDDIEEANWAHPRGPKSDVAQKANHPVTCVSWQDALTFCAWAGVRLPSEAQWEKAARGEDGRIWPWGNEVPDQERCNFNGNVGDTTAVGNYSKGASPYDMLDMAGNVWEWTRTLWGQEVMKSDFGYPYNANDGREDPAAAGRRVVRGGSFDLDDCSVRCASRGHFYPVFRGYFIGFRVLSPGS